MPGKEDAEEGNENQNVSNNKDVDMPEGKKTQLLSSVPTSHPRINGLLGVDAEKSCKEAKSEVHRFSLQLSPSGEKKFSEYNFQDLVKNIAKGKTAEEDKPSLYEDEDDSDQLKALAKKLEEKYDFVDIGYGYDDSDTFIDNSEAYDEVVPSDWTTEHGGFYINQGNLDFRPLAPEKDAHEDNTTPNKKKKKKRLLDEKKLSKTPKELSTHKKKKQLLNKEKQRKRQESLLKAHKILVKKQKKKGPPVIDDSSQDVPLAQLNKSFEDDMPLSKIAKASALSEDACPGVNNVSLDDNLPLAKIATSPQTSRLMTDFSNLSGESTQLENPKPINISGQNSNTSTPLHSSTTLSQQVASLLLGVKKNTTPESPEAMKATKVESPLPEGLSEELLQDIKQLKALAKSSLKGKFFTAEVNNVLVSFARKCRQQSPKLRNAVYDHILFYLPCAKDTLVKRCRALVVQHQRDLVDEPMRLLQQAIDASMPAQKKSYDDEVRKALQEQAREQIKQTGMDPKKPEDLNENSINGEDKSKKNFPKRKYSWSDEIRKLLCDVLQVRVGLYKMSKSRSMTAEEYIKDFMESEIRRMWPKGWMTSRILYKESRAAHQEITQPLSKGKKGAKKDGGTVDMQKSSTPTTSKGILKVRANQTGIITNAITVTTLTSAPTKKVSVTYPVAASSVVTCTSLNAITNAPTRSSRITSLTTTMSITPKTVGNIIFTKTPVSVKNAVSNSMLPAHLKMISSSNTLGQSNAQFVATMEKNVFMKAHPNQSIKPTLVRVHTSQLGHNKTVSVVRNAERTPVLNDTSVYDCSPKVSPYINTPTYLHTSAIATKVNAETTKAMDATATKQVKRKMPLGMESYDQSTSKRPISNILDYAATAGHTSRGERSWSEVENDFTRMSQDIIRNTHSFIDGGTNWPVTSSLNTQPNLQHFSQEKVVKHNLPINQATHKVHGVTSSKSNQSSAEKIPEFAAHFLSNVTSIQNQQRVSQSALPKQSIQHGTPESSPHHSLQQVARQSLLTSKIVPHQSSRKSPHMNQGIVSGPPVSAPIQKVLQTSLAHGKALEFHVPHHPASRMQQSSERTVHKYTPTYLQSSNAAINQHTTLHSHPTIKLMNELHRTMEVSSNAPSQSLLHQQHVTHAMHGMQAPSPSLQGPPETQRRLSLEQQIILQKEVMTKRNDPEYQSKYSNFTPHFN